MSASAVPYLRREKAEWETHKSHVHALRETGSGGVCGWKGGGGKYFS